MSVSVLLHSTTKNDEEQQNNRPQQERSNRMATTLPVKKTESIFDALQHMHDQIMKRAFEIFDRNGHTSGGDLDNWFQAEKELVWKPSIELEEKDNKFLLQVALAGVESKDIDIEVTPEEILVKADLHREQKEKKGKIHTSEFASGNLFRAVRLPKKIDPEKVKAEFKDGMLHLTAEIAQEAQARRIELKAS
jgi:HSP20 family protein